MESIVSLALFSLHEGVLQALQALLSRDSFIDLIVATQDPKTLVDCVEGLRPRVTIIDDFMLPDLASLCGDIQASFDGTRMIILRSALDATYDSIPAGDSITLQKPVRASQLVSELRRLAAVA